MCIRDSSYLALTQGEESYMSQAAINLWRGDMGESSGDAKEICNYLRELRHPLFGLNPAITSENPAYNVYPSVVTATTNLSGKELAYSLNFPKKSISGLPVIECAEFGRNVVSYDLAPEQQAQIELGCVFHMNHEENAKVHLSKESLASHTFITGSTGSGKSNTVYQLLNEAMEQGARFMVVEPAKGEYKHISVSYTHLDVYKRQAQRGDGECGIAVGQAVGRCRHRKNLVRRQRVNQQAAAGYSDI